MWKHVGPEPLWRLGRSLLRSLLPCHITEWLQGLVLFSHQPRREWRIFTLDIQSSASGMQTSPLSPSGIFWQEPLFGVFCLGATCRHSGAVIAVIQSKFAMFCIQEADSRSRPLSISKLPRFQPKWEPDLQSPWKLGVCFSSRCHDPVNQGPQAATVGGLHRFSPLESLRMFLNSFKPSAFLTPGVITSQPLKLLFCKTDALVAFTKLPFGASSFDRIHRCLAQCPHAPSDVYGQSLTKCFAVEEGMTSVMILEMPWNPKLKFCGCMPRHVCLTERLARFRRLDFQAVWATCLEQFLLQYAPACSSQFGHGHQVRASARRCPE